MLQYATMTDTLPAYLKSVDLGPPVQAVMQAIADGEHWLLAWNRQTDIIYRLLAKESGIGKDRLRAIEAGEMATRAEVTALARTWRVDARAVENTLPYPLAGEASAALLEHGNWVLQVESEPDVPMRLSFRGGQVFEAGMAVGGYADTADGVRASVGDDVVLTIGRPAGDVFPVVMVTLRHGDGADLVERAQMVRDGGAQ